ncbi:MAG: response regulator transcription factor [Psychromonas sp.]|nr:response regulator transcription factor [Alteromonadales bacterium]MCP5077474.1 response regulator transcription factor [Psychromonas sp.]
MLNILIVDDERLARVELKRLLSAIDGVTIIAEVNSAEAALVQLKNNNINLVFLDIQMPEVSGLQLAAQLDSSVSFVFCTAFNDYAVDAFSLNAMDYLVKPVNPDRLLQTIKRVKENHEIQAQEKVLSNSPVCAYLPDDHGLLLKFGANSRIIRIKEIERFESIGNHVAVYSLEGKSFIQSSLNKVESRLDPKVFFKASRSDIIRVDNIKILETGIATGSLLAVMKSGQEIEVSRRQAQTLKQLFNVW